MQLIKRLYDATVEAAENPQRPTDFLRLLREYGSCCAFFLTSSPGEVITDADTQGFNASDPPYFKRIV